MNEFIVYYHHDGTIVCISPRSLDEYDEQKNLIKELIKYNDDIQEIIDGTASLSNFVVENINANTIELKRKVHGNLQKADSINDYKVNFGKQYDILIEYNRDKNILKIKNLQNIITRLYLWFTVKNDPTILILSDELKLVSDNPESIWTEINLPPKFDLYCNMNRNFNFGYREK